MLKDVRSVLVGAASVQPVTKYVATSIRYFIVIYLLSLVDWQVHSCYELSARPEMRHASRRAMRVECTIDLLVTSAL